MCAHGSYNMKIGVQNELKKVKTIIKSYEAKIKQRDEFYKSKTDEWKESIWSNYYQIITDGLIDVLWGYKSVQYGLEDIIDNL